MIEINLLPKDYLKKSIDFSLGKAGIYSLAAAAGIILMLLAVTFYQKYQLSELDMNIQKAGERAAKLQKDIKLVDALTDVKNKITIRMQTVEKLDSHRSSWVRILEDMSQNVPEFVWLGKFNEKSLEPANPKDKKGDAKKEAPEPPKSTGLPTVRQGEVEGFAFTLNALASYMIKMMRSDYFDEVELVSTTEMTLQEKKAYNFVLNFNIHYLSDEELRNKIAAGETESDKRAETNQTSHKSLN